MLIKKEEGFSALSFIGGNMKLRRWNYSEERNGNHLLVWSNPPCWKIGDHDFVKFLEQFENDVDGKTIIKNSFPEKAEYKEAKQIFQQLVKEKILFEKTADIFKKESDKFSPIENIALNLTNKCNLRCVFCYNMEHLQENPDKELSSYEIIAFLKQVKPFCSKRVALTILGGEPLLEAGKLVEVVKFAKKKKFNVLVSSNGTQITDSFAKQARKLGLQVQVSIDGHNSDLNDQIRGKGSFDKILSGIQTLVANKVYTIISLVCHKGNFPYLKDFFQFALAQKVDEARFIPLKQMVKQLGKVTIEPINLLELVKSSAELYEQNPEFRKLASRDFFSITVNSCRHSNKRVSCGTGLQTFLLDADGSLYPCLNMNQEVLKFGNIRDQNFVFQDVWHNSSLLQEVRKSTNIDLTKAACSSCAFANWCLGGCHGETYAKTGKLDSSALNCSELRKAIIETMWVFAEKPDIIAEGNEFIC